MQLALINQIDDGWQILANDGSGGETAVVATCDSLAAAIEKAQQLGFAPHICGIYD
jgi:hypothetical protein